MPAAYAHYAFGKECLETLDDSLKKTIIKYRNIYDIGVHGPDIFFYYDPLHHSKIGAYGSSIHHLPSKGLFAKFKEAYKKSADKERSLSYIIGFLTHFCLDSCAHPFVNSEKEKLGITHNGIETEYEAHLLLKNGHKPNGFNRAGILNAQKEDIDVITQFFDFERDDVERTIKNQKTTISLYHSPLGIKKFIIRTGLRIVKANPEYLDLFVGNKTNSHLEESCKQLDALRNKALERFKMLCPNLLGYLNDQNDQLHTLFDEDFGG